MVFDTNVLIHSVNENSAEQSQCLTLLREARWGASLSFLSRIICYEFLRVSTHPTVFESPLSPARATRFPNQLLDPPGFDLLQPTEQHQAVLTRTLAELPDIRGNVMHDLHTAVLMRENNIDRICTFDRDFNRFPFLTVVDPLSL